MLQSEADPSRVLYNIIIMRHVRALFLFFISPGGPAPVRDVSAPTKPRAASPVTGPIIPGPVGRTRFPARSPFAL